MQVLKSSLAAAIIVGGLSTAPGAFAMPVSNMSPTLQAETGQGLGVQKVWWRYGYGWRRPFAYGYGWRRPFAYGYGWRRPLAYGYGWRRPWLYGYGPGRRWGGGYGYGWHNRRLLGSRAR